MVSIGLALFQQILTAIKLLLAHAAKPHVYQQLPQQHSFAGNFGLPSAQYGAPEPVMPTYAAPQAMPQMINYGSSDAMQMYQEPEAPAASPDTLAPSADEIAARSEMPAEQDSYNTAYLHSANTHHQTGYPSAPQETQVHKHIYVHVPPKDFEEEEAIVPRVTHQGGPKQKHYKIVFIKAPNAPAVRAPVVAPPPQNEEKTLIYVLHKKPEAQPDIVIPTAAPTKPSKPEVFFIKYKTKKEEAPVYGPPPANQQQQLDMEPRHASEPSAEYGAPISAADDNQLDATATTTPQPQLAQEEAQPQFVNDEPQPTAEAYGAPTMAAFASEESHSHAEPSNQYLAPENQASPIVVAEMEEQQQPRVPAFTYGTPNRFFIKRRK